MKKIFTLAVCVLLAATVPAQQEVKGIKQIFDITVDNLGNAMVEVSMKLNASQWDMFKRNIGNNTSILKREIEKSMPKYYLSDFNYSEDQMDRSYKIKFKTLGLCSINNNGKWEAKLETKDPDITRLSEREFVINANYMDQGMFFNQTQKIHLPSAASDAKIEKDSFGKAIMTYSTDSSSAGSKAAQIAGILLILAGGGLFFFGNKGPKNKLRVAKQEESMVA